MENVIQNQTPRALNSTKQIKLETRELRSKSERTEN